VARARSHFLAPTAGLRCKPTAPSGEGRHAFRKIDAYLASPSAQATKLVDAVPSRVETRGPTRGKSYFHIEKVAPSQPVGCGTIELKKMVECALRVHLFHVGAIGRRVRANYERARSASVISGSRSAEIGCRERAANDGYRDRDQAAARERGANSQKKKAVQSVHPKAPVKASDPRSPQETYRKASLGNPRFRSAYSRESRSPEVCGVRLQPRAQLPRGRGDLTEHDRCQRKASPPSWHSPKDLSPQRHCDGFSSRKRNAARGSPSRTRTDRIELDQMAASLATRSSSLRPNLTGVPPSRSADVRHNELPRLQQVGQLAPEIVLRFRSAAATEAASSGEIL